MIAAGYRERDAGVEAVACRCEGTTELSGSTATLCKGLSLGCLGSCPARAMPTSGMTVDPDMSAVFPASDFNPFLDPAKFMQLLGRVDRRFKNALILVAIVPEGTEMRINHIPVTSFPISISIVNIIPRQTTAPVNMRVTGIENPMEAWHIQSALELKANGSYRHLQRRTASKFLRLAARCTSCRLKLLSANPLPALSRASVHLNLE